MWYSNRKIFSVLASTIPLAIAIAAASPAEARDMGYSDRPDGGVEIGFSNGCTVIYNRNADRGEHSGKCKNKQLRKADGAASSYLKTSKSKSKSSAESTTGNTGKSNSGYPGSSTVGRSPVAENQMQTYCRQEATTTLETGPDFIVTLPVEKRGNSYVVYGQSPRSGTNVTTFECRFDSNRVFEEIKVTQNAQPE
ncbi:MAG: hypothetical protein KJO80_14950 [Gammaproteobacteria bacterium]|nr:hypothetical protein [Gammaproteobacteria bacterium]